MNNQSALSQSIGRVSPDKSSSMPRRTDSTYGFLIGKKQPKQTNKKVIRKEELSPRALELFKRFQVKVRVFMAMTRAKECIENHYEELNPGFKKVRKIVQTPYRTNSDAKFVFDFIKKFAFFPNFLRGFAEEVEEIGLIEMCKSIKHETYPIGEYIFKEGDLSDDKFYIVFKGSVIMTKKDKAKNFLSTIENKTPSLTYKSTSDSSPIDETDAVKLTELLLTHNQSSINSSSKREDSSSSNFKFTESPTFESSSLPLDRLMSEPGVLQKEIKRGEGFGELALTNLEVKRGFSIRTNTNCELLVITKKDFAEIVRRFNRKRMKKGEFMERHIPLLNTIRSPAVWETLHYVLKEVEYSKGANIASENIIGERIFFIGEGECSLEKGFTLLQTRNDHEPVKIKKVIATLSTGSCLGEEIVFGESQFYSYTIKVRSSSALLYHVERSIFLANFPQQCVEALRENFFLKQQLHEAKIQKISKEIMEDSASVETIPTSTLRPKASPSPTNFMTRSPIYGHMHVMQPMRPESKAVDVKGPKILDKELMILFPKEERTSSRAKNKMSDFAKRQLMSNASKASASPKRKENEIFDDPNVINPHVLIQKEKLKQVLRKHEKVTTSDKSLSQNESRLPPLGWVSPSNKDGEYKNQRQYTPQAFKIIHSISNNVSNMEDTPQYALANLKISNSNAKVSNELDDSPTGSGGGDKQSFMILTRTLASKQQHKRTLSNLDSPATKSSLIQKQAGQWPQELLAGGHKKRNSIIGSEVSIGENRRNSITYRLESRDITTQNMRQSPSPQNSVRTVIKNIGGNSSGSALKSFAQVLKKTFSNCSPVDPNASIDKIERTNKPIKKKALINSLNTSEEKSPLRLNNNLFAAPKIESSKNSPVSQLSFFAEQGTPLIKNPTISYASIKSKKKSMAKSISLNQTPHMLELSKTASNFKVGKHSGDSFFRLDKVSK